MRILLCLIVALVWNGVCPAQTPVANDRTRILDQEAAKNETLKKADGNSDAAKNEPRASNNRKEVEPPFASPDAVSAETRTKYEEALREFYQYQIIGLQHRRRVFQWQLFSSYIIFGVILALVGAGIYFAAVQFRAAVGEATKLKFGIEGFEVSSSILGVIILMISLAFFYCYLVYVYPIQEIF
ncbi:MAG: hypothetical protein ABI833_23130 [Acidobacteriota bacterium]